MSRFDCVERAAGVETYDLNRAFAADTRHQKVDLGIGAYRTDEGKPWVLPVVRKAVVEILTDESLDYEYLGQLGDDLFAQSATKLLLGDGCQAIDERRAFGIQCLSGTGALRIGADFLYRSAGFKTVYISDPSWSNHRSVFINVGFDEVLTYRYWDADNHRLHFEALIDDLSAAPEDSVVILQACAHNPTGVDPTPAQWAAIADVMAARKLFPFFDCAYQGFASGDVDIDAVGVRTFVDRGFELICAQSFAKNFGLYNERIGNLTVVLKTSLPADNVRSQITRLVRENYSNPPVHGSRIVTKVLNDPQLRQEWRKSIKLMRDRIDAMRRALSAHIERLGTPGQWSHITEQSGWFSFTGLTDRQIRHLLDEYGVYVPRDGRVSLCGLNRANVEYVADAIDRSVRKYPAD